MQCKEEILRKLGEESNIFVEKMIMKRFGMSHLSWQLCSNINKVHFYTGVFTIIVDN